ncbi:MAG: hypothetical protein JXB42_00100 [Deltaproteobacteria bacterium]|nr:hypothetical protein [Deltaproteobacteria bacterium]
MKGLFKTFFVSLLPFFFFIEAFSQTEDQLDVSREFPFEVESYINYAQKGSYENDFYVGECPEWHYFDLFGNKLLDGFYIFGMSMDRNNGGNGESVVSLHPFLKKWLNGLLQVGDISDQGGILAILGEGIKTRFTPFSFNQTYYTGARFDLFYDGFGGLNTASIVTSRISNTGSWGMTKEDPIATRDADWLHGIQLSKKYKDILDVGSTIINFHHEDNRKEHGNTFDGFDSDTVHTHTPTALYVYGLNGRGKFPQLNMTLYGEYDRSQEVLDGNFKPRPGNLGAFNGYWDFLNKGRVRGEGYIVESRYKTTFFCPSHPKGDEFGSQKYLYALIEDNDDKDAFPENGANKLMAIPKGDPDGVVPVKFDKNKNGLNDWEEDFLNFECDPPKSNLYIDRNNNAVPDEVEDDAYPDYPYVPGYYLSGEQYLRYDDLDKQTREDTSDGQVSKGILGFHLNGRYEIIPKLQVTLGAVVEASQEKSYQSVYEDTSVVGQTYAAERATTLYCLAQYRKDFASDKSLTVRNYSRIIRDNIPNHTQSFYFDYNSGVLYNTVVDELDYRDALVNMLVVQYSLYRNRGFNFTSRGKFEFTKHFAHLVYNYPGADISSMIFVNKCQYIYLLPFYKDMFLIPQYKNDYEIDTYGPRTRRLDSKFRNHRMNNVADVVYEWKCTPKTMISLGIQGKTFNDFFNSRENYLMGNYSTQLLLKDRYSGLNMVLTAGFSLYRYVFYKAPGIKHNPLNNPHRIVGNFSGHDLFLKVYGGF